jgi:hypothetical protein
MGTQQQQQQQQQHHHHRISSPPSKDEEASDLEPTATTMQPHQERIVEQHNTRKMVGRFAAKGVCPIVDFGLICKILVITFYSLNPSNSNILFIIYYMEKSIINELNNDECETATELPLDGSIIGVNFLMGPARIQEAWGGPDRAIAMDRCLGSLAYTFQGTGSNSHVPVEN